MQKVHFQDFKNADYLQTWDLQQSLLQACVDVKMRNRSRENTDPNWEIAPHQLLFVEHPPVFTLGRSGSLENLRLTEAELLAKNIQFFPINRGGDITFHGPGQLVGYPILDLECFFTDVHKYVRFLEEIFIRVCADFGIEAERIDGFTGVWIVGRGLPKKRKICAIGVHLSRWVTLHGWAFNVSTDLDFFNDIIPCGIVDDDKTVTSLERELGMKIDMDFVKMRTKHHFCAIFECELVKKKG
jgi:lipoyl(octanoyl) transferase